MAIWAAALPQKLNATRDVPAAPAPRRYMPGAPEIYFHKAIDNSRLVRAVDPGRKREMHLFTAALAFSLMVVLLYLGQHCNSIEYGYKIEASRTQLDQLSETNRSLKLEEATLKDPERINALAQQMGMSLPAVGQVQRMDDASTGDGVPVMARVNNIAVISVPN